MAEATVGLLRDHERRARLGAAARQRVIDKFTLHRSVDGFRRIYLELAGHPEPQPLQAEFTPETSGPCT